MNEAVFKPIKIRNLEIKNKVVLPPLVCFGFTNKDGFVTEKNIAHYEAMAKGGSGLIIVEATAVDKNGRLSEDQLGIWSDKYIEGLTSIANICHENDTKVFVQLHHAGLKTPKNVTEDTVTASNYEDEKITARALTKNEILEIEDEFVNAAIRVEKAGFDGIELHGAHSYLLTQFLSEKINQRTDEYGGSFENRILIVREIFSKIRAKVNKNFIIGIRMGCNENNLETSINIAKYFEAIGMDYLNVSTGFDNTKIEITVPEEFPCNWIVYGASKIKENVNIPVIAVNSIRTTEQINYLIENNFVDFVAVGRGQLADYNFTNHIKEGIDIIECLNCRPCKWFTDGSKCPRHI